MTTNRLMILVNGTQAYSQEDYEKTVYEMIARSPEEKELAPLQKDFAHHFLARRDLSWTQKLAIASTPGSLFALTISRYISDLSDAQQKRVAAGFTPAEVRSAALLVTEERNRNSLFQDDSVRHTTRSRRHVVFSDSTPRMNS